MCPDFGDEAAERSEQLLREALQRRRPELPYAGGCYNCDQPLAAPLRFCDADCRDDYERREKVGND